MINVPLADKGVADANRAHEFLSSQPIERVISSPLCRAVRTAEIICPNLCIEQNNGLFPWSIPTYWGKSKDEFDEAIEGFIKTPSKTPPMGESLNDFMDRTGDFFEDQLNEHCMTLFVAHTTNIIAFCDLCDGTQNHDKVIQPGGVIGIYCKEDGDGYGYKILLGKDTKAD